MGLKQVTDRIRSHQMTTIEAVHCDLLPDHLLQYFMCDIAQKVLQSSEDDGFRYHSALHDALRIQREWIEGKRTASDVIEAYRILVSWIAHHKHYGTYSKQYNTMQYVLYAVEIRTDLVPLTKQITNLITFNITRLEFRNGQSLNKTEVWQREHLLELIEQYQASRSSLLSVLLQREEQLAIMVPRWQEETSDALYL